MLNIQLRHVTIWAKDRFQPLNADADFLCKIIGKKTLDPMHVKICMQHGHSVEVCHMNIVTYIEQMFPDKNECVGYHAT